MQGFLILNCTIGGQTLASVSSHLDDTLGIVIIGCISMAVSCSSRYICCQTCTYHYGPKGNILWLSSHSLVNPYLLPFLLCPTQRSCSFNFRYESAAWIPNVITIIIMLGVGGKHLVNAPAAVPVTTASIVTFATTTTSSVVSWCTMTPDYGVYHNGKTPT